MKLFVIGFFSALALVGVVYVFARKTGDSTLSYHIITKKERIGRQGGYEVFRNDELLFGYYVFGNGFSLSVPSERPAIPRMYFSKSDQQEPGILYELSSSQKIEDGSDQIVVYDMRSGDIETRIISKDGRTQAFDRNGKSIKSINSKEANQALVPTSMSVTDRADAHSAPATGAAHL